MSEQVKKTMAPRERRILALAVAAHALVHIFDGMVAPLVPLLIAEFDVDYFRVGVVVTLFSVLFGAGALPAGILADRLGPRRLVTWFLLGSGVAFVLVFLVQSFLVYAAIMATAGLFCSVYHPAANTLIGKEISLRGRAFGIHGIAGSVGTAAAPVLIAWIGSRAGWRAPHVIFGVVAITAALYSIRIPVRASAAEAEASPVRLAHGSAPVLSLVIFYVAASLLGLAYRGTMTFLPSFLGEQVRISGIDMVTAGGMLATLTLISGAFGQYVGGRLVDRRSPEYLYLGALAVSTVFLLGMIHAGAIGLVISAIGFALFHFAVQPMQNDLIARYVTAEKLGAAYGLHFLLVFGAGSFGGAGAGYLADRFGLRSVFVATAICFALATFLIGVLAWRRDGAGGRGRKGAD